MKINYGWLLSDVNLSRLLTIDIISLNIIVSLIEETSDTNTLFSPDNYHNVS